MKHSIAMVIVFLTAYVLMISAQLPTTWTNPYYFFSNINTPPIVAPQKISADETEINSKTFTNYDDHSIQNTLSSHVVLLTTCLRDLKTTKTDLAVTHTTVDSVKNEIKDTKDDLAKTHAEVESVKNELNALKGAKNELAQTHTTIESIKKELANVITTVENMKKDASVGAAFSIGRMPQSCDDLQKIGHRKSGLFSVMGSKTVDNVYCDFTKPTNDAGFQKLIGYFDVKTSPVYFHAQRSSVYTTLNTIIPFDLLRLNFGNAMNTNGIFVAPKPGKYLFTYLGISGGNSGARIELQMKNATGNWSRVGEAWGAHGHQTFSLQSTLELAKGDQIKLTLLEGSTHDEGSANRIYTNFVGQLLEEDIIQ